MGVAYKNFWSLNTDEAVVTGILRNHFKKKSEVFMPLNAQLKDIDLILANLKKKKFVTIQIKGSRAYEPNTSEIRKFGKDGSGGWFFISKKVVDSSAADFFVFLIYVLIENNKKGRRYIEPHTLTIPTKELKRLCLRYKKPHPLNYSFYFRIHLSANKAFDWRDKEYNVSNYLDNKGFEKLANRIK